MGSWVDTLARMRVLVLSSRSTKRPTSLLLLIALREFFGDGLRAYAGEQADRRGFATATKCPELWPMSEYHLHFPRTASSISRAISMAYELGFRSRNLPIKTERCRLGENGIPMSFPV